MVNYKAHIGFVNAHAKGYGGYNHVHFLHQECVLIVGAGGCVHAGMVWQRADVVDSEQLGQFFHALAAEAVDYARFAGVLLYEAYDVVVGVLGLGPYLIEQVRAVERRFEHSGIAHTQVFLYVVLHLWGGSGGKRYYRAAAYFIDYRAYAAILGPEIMPPFRYAVRLVDGVERYCHCFQKLYVLFFGQRLRSHVQQLGEAVAYVGFHLVDGRTCKR